MPSPKRIVVVGATSLIAEHCARIWASEGPNEFILVGRDATRLEAISADLRVRNPQSTTITKTGDFLDSAAIGRLVEEMAAGGPIDVALIAHGTLPDQAGCQSDLAAVRDAIEINGVSPALFAEAFASRMLPAGRGTVAIIGSVAGDRGRKSNYVYGAAKGLVDRYAQGLQHRLAGSGVKVVLVKPGPTDTPMTASFKASGRRLAPVEDVARTIVRGIAAGHPVVYAPPIWRLVMLVIRHLPRFVFNRLDI
jgi:short-subunit dehydrogenase